MTKTCLYWAYGSNLCVRNMKERCPGAKKLRRLYVQGGQLVFRGVADVTTKEDSVVPGGLWRITKDCERALDRYEGVASGLYMKKWLEVEMEGNTYEVLFYQMRMSRGVMPPSECYLDTIVEGYRDFGLDTAVLDIALQESWSNKNVTDTLRRRHFNKGMPTLARAVPGSYVNENGVVKEVHPEERRMERKKTKEWNGHPVRQARGN